MSLYACPKCGCTDVEVTAWIEVNNGEVIHGDPPTNDAYCPQCEFNGDEGDLGKAKYLVETEDAKPFEGEVTT